VGMWVASSYSAWRRFVDFSAAQDDRGTAELEARGAVAFVEGKYRVIRNVGTSWEIRLLEGPLEGEAVWTGENGLTKW